jgi:methylated-DNA-[protein]-cysteine S-methyltransferase
MDTRIEELRIDSPLGPMRLLADATGLTGIYFVGQKYEPAPAATANRAAKVLQQGAGWLAAYFSGRAVAATPPLAGTRGTDFQRGVWTALRGIAAGDTQRYGELAAGLGQPQAARAVGAAVGRNPWSVLVPCHRVTGSDGRLTGYAGGLGRKAALLALESGKPLPWVAVSRRYRTRYHTPVEVVAGETVQWLPHADHGEFPGWAFARAASGREGWLPRDWFGPGEAQSMALRSYSAQELDADVGDRVLDLDRFGGWVLARHSDQRVGWIPLAHLT